MNISDLKYKDAQRNTTNLCWNIFLHRFNERKIDVVNIFELSAEFIRNFIKTYNEYKTLSDDFFKELDHILRYTYWARCEYEIILGTWPTHLTGEEVDRLSKEREDNPSKYGYGVNLDIEEKVDVYMQVLLNWEGFVTYLKANEDLIKKYIKENKKFLK